MHLSSSLIAKGLNTYVNKVFLFFTFKKFAKACKYFLKVVYLSFSRSVLPIHLAPLYISDNGGMKDKNTEREREGERDGMMTLKGKDE